MKENVTLLKKDVLKIKKKKKVVLLDHIHLLFLKTPLDIRVENTNTTFNVLRFDG